MQTILGANGQIGEELARELKRNFTSDIRIVSRRAQKVNDTDEIFSADLSVREKAIEAVKGSEIAYFTLGLPISSDLWEKQFPVILRNVIDACKVNGTKLVFFDNTYMYPQDDRILTENTAFDPVGRKGRVRRQMAESGITLLGISLIFHFDSSYQLGIIFGVVSSAFAALYTIGNERLASSYDSRIINYYQMFGGTIGLGLLLPIYLYFFPVKSIIPEWKDTIYLVLLSVFCTVALYVSVPIPFIREVFRILLIGPLPLLMPILSGFCTTSEC
ncbi:NAD(P)H-binding protein [Elizabethkingia anophelis]|nr:NAD(P)H-binding protein [Elizabethkingia anophelis]